MKSETSYSEANRQASETDDTTSATVLEQAKKAHSFGMSVLPIKTDGSKATTLTTWKRLQENLPSTDDVDAWFSGEVGLGIVTGSVSGGLECLDFDDPEILESFCKRAEEWGIQELLEKVKRGYYERTPNGHHLLYRCNASEGNQKLASRETVPEDASGSKSESKVLNPKEQASRSSDSM